MPRVKIRRRPRTWSAYSHPEDRAELLEELHRPDREWVKAWASELAAAVAAEHGPPERGLLGGTEQAAGATRSSTAETLLANAGCGH